MTHLFISDLHLSPDHPRLVRGFLALLQHYQDKNTRLYILGDWFNAWIGDDYSAPWLDEIVVHLKAFTQAGNQVFFQVGNRDFALGQKFLDQFNGQLIAEPTLLHMNQIRIRIEHGDALCTDDVSYQKFRKIIRNPLLLGFLKRLPLSIRQKIANGFRKKSSATKQVKSYDIMDVNADAVLNALIGVDILLHGHTHRADIHNIGDQKRIVLGDWRESEAQILEIHNSTTLEQLSLKPWHY